MKSRLRRDSKNSTRASAHAVGCQGEFKNGIGVVPGRVIQYSFEIDSTRLAV